MLEGRRRRQTSRSPRATPSPSSPRPPRSRRRRSSSRTSARRPPPRSTSTTRRASSRRRWAPSTHLASTTLALAAAFGGLTVATAEFATDDPELPITFAARQGEPVVLAAGDAHLRAVKIRPEEPGDYAATRALAARRLRAERARGRDRGRAPPRERPRPSRSWPRRRRDRRPHRPQPGPRRGARGARPRPDRRRPGQQREASARP